MDRGAWQAVHGLAKEPGKTEQINNDNKAL